MGSMRSCKYIVYILTVILLFQLLPTKAFAGEEKAKVKERDEYTLLSNSNSPLEIRGSEVNIKGNVRTNGSLLNIIKDKNCLNLANSSLDLVITRKFGSPHLQWKEVAGATYRVKRGTSYDNLKIIAENISNTFYDDNSTDMSTKYFYSVEAVKNGIKGVDSNKKARRSLMNEVASNDIEASNTEELTVFVDTDVDGICDEDEVRFKTDPEKADTDGDGLLDGEEVEIYHTNPLKADTDGDGLNDYVEVHAKSDKLCPLKADTDNNGILDGEEDFDNDGLNNIDEVKNKTNMFIADTDNDGISDSKEVNCCKTDPTQYDTDGDKLGDGVEIQRGTNPLNSDTNGNGILDGDENCLQVIYPALTVDPSTENGNIIKKIKISFDATGEANENTAISNLYGVDIKSSKMPGLIGYPINIETISKFTNAEISFNYDTSVLKNISSDNLGVLWYDMKNDKYVQMPVKLDKTNNILMINTSNFGTYLIVNVPIWNNSLRKESTLPDKNKYFNKAIQFNNIDNDKNKINYDSHDKKVREVEETIKAAGFEYDSKQDIYKSIMNPTQRAFGYNRLYDEGAILNGMIIDCEPIYFTYDNKNWMIELWKGQYDLPTGCEVGIYNERWGLPEAGGLYQCVTDDVLLDIHYILHKKDKGNVVWDIERGQEKHWWLTTFRPGEYSETSQLSMDVDITLKDEAMVKAFQQGLEKANYHIEKNDYIINGTKVTIKYDKPHTKQPFVRTDFFERATQWKNKAMCDKYEEIKKRLGLTRNDPESITKIIEYYPKIAEQLKKYRGASFRKL